MQRQTVETLAKASWALPLLTFGLNAMMSSQGHEAAITMAILGCGIYLLAFICGVISLFMTRKFGKEKILAHAIVGTCLSGGLLLLIGFTILMVTMMRK